MGYKATKFIGDIEPEPIVVDSLYIPLSNVGRAAIATIFAFEEGAGK
jgi:hypothetical protein